MNISKRILVAITAILIGVTAQAQILKPVKWAFSVKQTKADEATLVFTATIDKTFHVYSQFVENGPSPTVFDFKKTKEYDLIGKVQESKAIEEYDINFDTKLKYFETKAVFKQTIKIKAFKDFKVAGVLNYMSCNDKMCLPPEDVEFSFTVKGSTIVPPNIVEAITPLAADAIPIAPNDSIKPTKSSSKDSMSNSTATAVVKADMT
jgi:thiol:disulfide interchange protein DsbD